MAQRKAKFGKWLANELTERGWSNTELKNRSGMSHSMISMLINNHDRVAGLDSCAGVARALNYSLEFVLIKAGHLAYLPADKQEEGEFLHLFRKLDKQQKKLIMLSIKSWLEYEK